MDANGSALVAAGISVALGGVEILRDVELEVAAGHIVGVLGPSGAGKSTLFKVIAGEIAPRGGRVTIAGRDVTGWPLHRRARAGLGYVPQSPSVLFDLTVRDNLRTFERAAGVPPRPAEERARTVGLEDHLETRARDLSGGERRRLEVLRALVTDPQVLLCDEPFSSGDPVHVRLLSKLLRSHADEGHSVLLADHRISDALGICDRAILLAEGQIQAEGPAEGFADHPKVRGRYLG